MTNLADVEQISHHQKMRKLLQDLNGYLSLVDCNLCVLPLVSRPFWRLYCSSNCLCFTPTHYRMAPHACLRRCDHCRGLCWATGRCDLLWFSCWKSRSFKSAVFYHFTVCGNGHFLSVCVERNVAVNFPFLTRCWNRWRSACCECLY